MAFVIIIEVFNALHTGRSFSVRDKCGALIQRKTNVSVALYARFTLAYVELSVQSPQSVDKSFRSPRSHSLRSEFRRVDLGTLMSRSTLCLSGLLGHRKQNLGR